MKNHKLTIFLLAYALLVIPAVHLIAPLFFAEVPQYVSTGEGSIIGQTNVKAQLLPFVIAYLSAPILLLLALLRIRKARKQNDI